MGQTDGPPFVQAQAQWERNDNEFSLRLERTYDAGQQAKEATAMGEFQFEVKRSFVGQVTTVGEALAVSGKIQDVDPDFGDREVGYFNLIDTTKEREAHDGPVLKPRVARSS